MRKSGKTGKLSKRLAMTQLGKSGQVQEVVKICINLPQVSSLPNLIYNESKKSVRKVEGYNKCPRNQRTKGVLRK